MVGRMRPRRSQDSGFHKVEVLPLPVEDMAGEYEVHGQLGEGCFARVVLATHRRSATTVVLKMVHTELTTLKDFHRELHYSYLLSPHPNILCSYPVAFRAYDCWVFAQEHAPLGDLAGVVRAGGVPETTAKKVARQLSSALEFVHSKQLVHRDVKLENILVFAADLSTVKLCDFGEIQQSGVLVTKVRCTWRHMLPPEICDTVIHEKFPCDPASDCWQVGILIFLCLTGCPPWASAELRDPAYRTFSNWQRRRTTRVPPSMRRFSSRLQRLLRRLLDPRPEHRAPVTEVAKYLQDKWLLGKSATTKDSDLERHGSPGVFGDYLQDDDSERPEGQTGLDRQLSNYGLETSVDPSRLWQWLLTSDAGETAPGWPQDDGTSQVPAM